MWTPDEQQDNVARKRPTPIQEQADKLTTFRGTTLDATKHSRFLLILDTQAPLSRPGLQHAKPDSVTCQEDYE